MEQGADPALADARRFQRLVRKYQMISMCPLEQALE